MSKYVTLIPIPIIQGDLARETCFFIIGHADRLLWKGAMWKDGYDISPPVPDRPYSQSFGESADLDACLPPREGTDLTSRISPTKTWRSRESSRHWDPGPSGKSSSGESRMGHSFRSSRQNLANPLLISPARVVLGTDLESSTASRDH